MKGDEVTEAVLRQVRQSFQTARQLTLVWREAHGRARRAYEQWCLSPGEATYAHYRAAQDQADSAQDELHAEHTRAVATRRLEP